MAAGAVQDNERAVKNPRQLSVEIGVERRFLNELEPAEPTGAVLALTDFMLAIGAALVLSFRR